MKQILTGRLRIPDAELVYAIGLFDYLPQPVAARLAELGEFGIKLPASLG